MKPEAHDESSKITVKKLGISSTSSLQCTPGISLPWLLMELTGFNAGKAPY